MLVDEKRADSCYTCRRSRTSRRNSRPDVFCEKGVFRNFTQFIRKYLCQSPFFNKLAGRPAALLKKILRQRCFPVNFGKFLRTHFLTEYLRWLLLKSIQAVNISSTHLCKVYGYGFIRSDSIGMYLMTRWRPSHR